MTAQPMPKPKLLQGMTVAKLVNGYENTVDAKPGESGPGHVISKPFGADGPTLIIRPSFQRNFIYDANEQAAVLKTVARDYPLSAMYVGRRPDGGDYKMLDGQQRTISICRYVCDPKNDFYISGLFGESSPRRFRSLNKREQQAILNYELMVFECIGDDDQQLDWFRTINIAGKALAAQELLNAIKDGPWTQDAKTKFGGKKPPATGSAINM